MLDKCLDATITWDSPIDCEDCCMASNNLEQTGMLSSTSNWSVSDTLELKQTMGTTYAGKMER